MAGFLLFSFDYQQAQVSGLHTRWLHYGLLCMVSDHCGDAESGRYHSLHFSAHCASRHCGTPDTTLSYCAPTGDWHIGNSVNDWCLVVLFIDSAPAPTIVVLFAVLFIMTFAVTSINARKRETPIHRICYHPISTTSEDSNTRYFHGFQQRGFFLRCIYSSPFFTHD